ncbi:hypothetical protein CPB86DRAFT_384551 [Serendipita vermifera]|nr:hypothetical protein CPB86DRAFT_384551 [Serendipita vermifera]
MHWPDDENNARKPRYSAETGSRLLEKKNNDLENLKNEISKLKERLDTITLERDDVTNKLRTEITRSTDLEESLLARKEELVQEKLSRVNLEKELQSASDSCRLKDLEHRQLQRQLEDMSSRHNDVDQRNKISSLERKVQALQLENARLSGQVERPVSRNSSIPVPKGRQPRPSSDVRSSHLEDEIKTCRVELAEERSKVKRAEAKMRKAEADATQYLNEKIAAERKAQQQIEELENRLQEANDQLSSLPTLSQPDRENNVDVARYEKVLKDYRGVEEQLQAAKADNIDLTNRLNRKSAQCETLQEKLDECLYSAPDVESLSQELAIAKKEASDALKELAFLKESKRDNPNRRETLLAVRYELEDRDRELRTLQEKLRRRESSSAELEAQLEQISRLFSEREDLKDELAKANSRIRFLEPQSQFNQKEISLLRSQVTELEVELRKQRSLNSQQQELYHEIVKSCSEAERKAEELDQELSNLQEEFANRSSASEAVERRQQWEEALERVQELERELAGHKDKSRRAPRRSRPSLLPVPNFGDPSELDMVAKVVLALDRIREERNALRGSVEFLNFELQAKDAAIERRLENQKARFLNLLQSAEKDIVSLRQDLSACEDEISQLYQSRDEDDRIRRAQNISTATLVALQHINGVLDSEHERYTQEHAKLESELRDKDALEETVNKLTTLAQTKEDALSSLNVRYQEAIRDLQEATQSLRETQGKIRDLEETRDKLQDTLDDRTATLRNLERDHAAQTLHLERLEEAHQIAREELYEARVEADQLRNDHMNTLSEENPDAQSALMRHIEELDQRIMRRNEQIGIQQNEYRRLDMNLKIAEEAAENMRTELEELRVQRVWLEEDASNVRQERNLALRELEDVRVELDNVRTSLEKLETTNSTNEEARSKEAATLIELVFSSRAEIQAIKLSAKEEGSNACDPQLPLASSSVQDASVQVISDNESMQELEEAKRAIETLTNARIQESERLHNAEQRNTELQASLEEATSRGDALASQLRRATELAREELENRLVTLEEQVESLSVEVETLEERLAEGQEQLTMVLEQNGDLENQVTDLQSQAAASSKEAEQKAAEWEAEINELRTERDQLSQRDAEYVDLLQKHEVLEREHSAALLVVTGSEKLKEQLDALQADTVEYNLTVDKLSLEVENYRVEREEFLSKLSDLDSLRANLRDRTQELEALQASRQQVEDELIALQDSMTQLQQIVDQRSSALRQCQEELDKALKEMDIVPQLRSTITQLEASTAKLQHELGEAQQAASAAASTTIRDAEADVRIIQLETSLATLKEENEELERVLTLKTKEIDDYDDRHIE